MCSHMCSHPYKFAHTHVCALTYMCLHIYVHVCSRTYTSTHTHLCSHSRFCTLMVPVHTPASRRALQGHACTLGPHTPTRRAHVCARAHTCTCTRAHTRTHMCRHTRAHTCTHTCTRQLTRGQSHTHVHRQDDTPVTTELPPDPTHGVGRYLKEGGGHGPPRHPLAGGQVPHHRAGRRCRALWGEESSAPGGAVCTDPPTAPGPPCSHVPKQP